MKLTRKQMAEVVAFDWKRRTGLDFDGRRYGDVTGAKAPRFTESWQECHGSVVYLGRKPTRKTLRYNYIVRAKPSRSDKRPDVMVLNVAVRLNGAYQPVVKDVGRWSFKTGHLELRDIDFHGLGGWIVEWDKEDWAGKRTGRRAGDLAGKILDDGWCSGGKWKFNTGLTFPWYETVNVEALKGTKYEWCQYGDDTPCKAGLVDWLMMYNQEPKIELLAKAGLHQLICPAGIKALQDKRILGWIMQHREEAAKRHRDGRPRYDTQDIIYAARHGGTILDAERRREFVQEARRFVGVCKAYGRIDYDRLRKALRKWHVGLDEYSRYLEYAHDSGLDLRNDGTKYPPTRGGREAFMERLERLEARARHIRREKLRKERVEREAEEKWVKETMKTRVAEIEAFQKSLKRTDILKGCGYTLVLAKSQEELLAEGKKMNNCVGCGTYGQGIVTGGKLIVMLKYPNGVSYCDIEIDRRNWTVRQCYLKGNEAAPQEIRELAKRIAAWFKEEHKRHMKRGTFRELKRKAA